MNIVDYSVSGTKVDSTGKTDVSAALAGAISAANEKTAKGEPACVYLPTGIYRISSPPPPFVRAGCVIGDGSSLSIINLDPTFAGDLFSWSEAWVVTTPGPRVVGLRIVGDKNAEPLQNAFVFYDRNDELYMDDIDVFDLHGRVLYSGVTKNAPNAYMRESHFRSLRFFGDGAPAVPVVEFNSRGIGQTDATNEIRMSQVDVYGSHGPSFVIRNEGTGVVRDITIDGLRIEGLERGGVAADLLTIGDPVMKGGVKYHLDQSRTNRPVRGICSIADHRGAGISRPLSNYRARRDRRRCAERPRTSRRSWPSVGIPAFGYAHFRHKRLHRSARIGYCA